jgi:hypothetical protein
VSTSKLEPGLPFTVAMLLFPGVAQLDLTGPRDLVEQVRSVMKPMSERQAAAIEKARARLAGESV